LPPCPVSVPREFRCTMIWCTADFEPASAVPESLGDLLLPGEAGLVPLKLGAAARGKPARNRRMTDEQPMW